jgi:hypothetical protein
VPDTFSSLATTDDDDDLPRPGKVWEGPSVGSLLDPPSPKPAPAPPPPASNIEPVDPNNLPAIWKTLLSLLQERKASLHSLVSPGRLVDIKDDQAVIRYAAADDFFPKSLARNGKKELLSDAFSQVLGRVIGVRFEVDAAAESGAAEPPSNMLPSPSAPTADQPPSRPTPQAPAPPPRLTNEQRQELEKDPLIRALLTDLGATIIKLADE